MTACGKVSKLTSLETCSCCIYIQLLYTKDIMYQKATVMENVYFIMADIECNRIFVARLKFKGI